MDNTRWSHTRLQSYLRCPLAYRLHYVDGEPWVATEAMIRGKYLHEAIERYARHCYRGGQRPIQTDFAAGRAIADGYPGLEETLRRWVENWAWEWSAILPGDQSPVEQMYQAALPNGQAFCGRVDLLQRFGGTLEADPFAVSDEEWWVTDWKSGYGLHSENDPPLQLLGYAWLVQRTWPEAQRFRLAIECVGIPWSPKPWVIEGDLGWVADKFCSIIARIEDDTTFEANVGPECVNCTMVVACPQAQKASVKKLLGWVPSDLAAEVPMLDSLLALAKRTLKAVVKESGPIQVGPAEAWQFTKSEYQTPASERELSDFCEGIGVNYWDLLTMSAEAVRKLKKRLPEEVLPDLDRLLETKSRTTFGLGKVGAETTAEEEA